MRYQEGWQRWARDLAGMLAGSFLVAAGLVAFLIPNRIAAGGVSGLATIIHYLLHFPVGAVILALNVPLFLLSLRELGIPFGIRTLYGTLTLGIWVDVLTPYLKPLTQDLLLAAIYGGVAVGIGMGLVFRFRGSTGGTDLAARLLNKYVHISLGQSLLLIDFMVITAAGIVFSAELAMYALLSLFVSTQVIDLVQEGMGFAKAVYIISERTEEITRAIFRELDRGATSLKGRGLYTGRDREIILCVVSRAQITALKDLVYRIDPQAFVIVTDAREVLGEGFQRHF